MTNFKKLLFLGAIICLCNCASYKAKKQEAQLNLPQLGSIVTTKGGLLYETAEQIGVPKWQTLKVEAQELPFNIESYTAYSSYMEKAGRINSIPFNDTLRFKPKYLRFTLQDKIGLTKLLNNEEHKKMSHYLSLEDANKMVTSLDVAATENEIQLFYNAEAVELQKDKFDNIVLVRRNGANKTTYFLKELPVFNYGLSTFCWGEDQYHNPRIENIVDEKFKCPKNTYQKASKIKRDKAYLKF